jgi:hypothetical protein
VTKLALGAKFAKYTKLTKISVLSVFSVAKNNSVNPCSSVAETQSIKNNKLCKTNPISQNRK